MLMQGRERQGGKRVSRIVDCDLGGEEGPGGSRCVQMALGQRGCVLSEVDIRHVDAGKGKISAGYPYLEECSNPQKQDVHLVGCTTPDMDVWPEGETWLAGGYLVVLCLSTVGRHSGAHPNTVCLRERGMGSLPETARCAVPAAYAALYPAGVVAVGAAKVQRQEGEETF